MINYAYGFVVCCKPGRADAARTQMQSMMERLRPPHPLGVSKSVNIYFQVASLAVGDTFQAASSPMPHRHSRTFCATCWLARSTIFARKWKRIQRVQRRQLLHICRVLGIGAQYYRRWDFVADGEFS